MARHPHVLSSHVVKHECLYHRNLPSQIRLVESLGLMWEEERARCGGRDPPSPPPDTPRAPKTLCRAVDYVRAQFQVQQMAGISAPLAVKLWGLLSAAVVIQQMHVAVQSTWNSMDGGSC